MRTLHVTKLSLLALGLGACVGKAALAQTFTPPAAATSTTTTLSTTSGADQQLQSVAVDSVGNVFFSRPANGILVELPANGGAEIVLFTASSGGGGYPKGVAANDTYAYQTDYSGALWQVPIAGGAATNILGACSTLDNGYLGTQDVTTDGLGNVYVAGNNINSLFKITAAGACSIVSGVTLDANSHVAADAAGDLAFSTGGVLYSLPVGATTAVAVPGTFNSIIGLRASAGGDVFVTTYSGIVEVPFISGALDGTRAFTVLAGSSQNDVAVQPNGTIYTTNGSNVFKNVLGSVRYSATAVNVAAASQLVNVFFNSTQVLTSIRYVTDTGTSTEIANDGSGSCATGQSYSAGASCTLSLSFTAKLPGARTGAVILSAASGTIGSIYIAGQGTGAGLVVDPGTQTTLGTGWQSPSGIAVGKSGSVFVADKTAGTLSYFAPGSPTAAIIATGLSQPSGVAVGLDGTAYVATGTGTIVRVPYSGTAYGTAATVATGLKSPSSLAVGPDGSLYVANTGAGTVIRFPNQAGTLNFAQQLAVGTGFKSPMGLAFDGSGNLFVADSTAGSIFEVAGGATSAVVTGITSPVAVTVDASGTLYLLQSGVATVLRIPLTNGGYSTNSTTTLGSGFTTLAGLSIDSSGNLFVADSAAPSVTEIQRTVGSLNLGRINVGSSSSTQSLSFSNEGNGSLALGSPLYATSGNTGDFSITTTGSSACAAGGTLTAGSSCGISGTFTPTTTGTRTETLTLSSNAVNASPITGAFTGTGINLPKTTLALTTTPTGTVTYGTSISATAVVAPPAGSTTTPTGTVTFLVNGSVFKVVPLAAGSASTSITGLPAGVNTIDATYSGDNTYAASSGATQTITVTLASTTTTLTSSISSTTPVAPGTSVTLSATVSSSVTTTKPTGTVNFVSSGTTLVSAPVNTTTGVATITTTTLPSGTYTITAIYTGDSGFATSTSPAVSVSIRSQQYDITGAPTALTVSSPGSVSTTFSVVPISGYVGGIDMACSGLPANTQCTFLPAVVAFTGANNTAPQNVTLTITTNTPAATTVVAWILPLGGLLLLGVTRKRKLLGTKRILLTVTVALMSAGGLLSMGGCGSTNISSPKGTSTVTVSFIGTPNGTTTVPTTGAGNIPKSFTFTLTVQ